MDTTIKKQPEPKPKAAPQEKPDASDVPAKFTNSVKNLLDEYYEIRDLEEAKECVLELKANDAMYTEFVHSVLTSVRKEPRIPLAAKLLVFLRKVSLLTNSHLEGGFKRCFDTVGDDSEEFPNLPKFYGKLFGQLVKEGSMNLSFLSEIHSQDSKMIILRFNGAALDTNFEGKEEVDIVSALKEAGFSSESLTRKEKPDRLPRYFSVSFYPVFFEKH